MIEIKQLSHSYRRRTVLHEVDLFVGKHEVCALVGNNGAGKSTLIQSMLGLLPVKEGSVSFGGIPQRKGGWKRLVAYLPEKFQLYPHLTGKENMDFFAGLSEEKVSPEKLERALREVGLWESRELQAKHYSKGMLQRLGLAIMLAYDSEILILDEPTSGLDPQGRKELLAILKELKEKTILFSSHHLDEIKQVCTHVAHLVDGRVRKYTIDQFFEQVWKEGESL